MADLKAAAKLGCLGTAGLVVLMASALLILAWFQIGGETLSAKEFEQALLAKTAATDPASVDLSLPLAPRTRVLVDIKDADVQIFPGSAGQPLRAEATFDPRYFAFQRKPVAEGTADPTVHVWFRRVAGGAAMHVLRQFLGAERAQVRIFLPPDLPLDLRLNTSSGLTRVDLGGLRVEEFYAELSTGGLSVDNSEPSLPMDRFEVDARQSTISVRNLGNASPREVKIECLMGRAEIDLQGAWRQDAEVLLETEMAGGSLRLPETVNVQGLPGAVAVPESEEVPRPTIRFAVESTLGELAIER